MLERTFPQKVHDSNLVIGAKAPLFQSAVTLYLRRLTQDKEASAVAAQEEEPEDNRR